MDQIEIIKELDLQEVMEWYGVEFKRGKALCPFHRDNHPSMTIKRNKYHCWACNASGDVIDFVSNRFGLNFRDSISKLNDDFGLGLDISGGSAPSEAQKRRFEREKEVKQELKMQKQKRIDELNTLHRELMLAGREEERQKVEAELDRLIFGEGSE